MKTCFLCRYLAEEGLRREINDGLNVVEQWNSANDFVFFARRGELASNRAEDHELSMLSLHLLQNCMVFVNTLMLQQMLARPHWANRLTPRDRHRRSHPMRAVVRCPLPHHTRNSSGPPSRPAPTTQGSCMRSLR